MNQNITWKIVQDNPDKPWIWLGLSRNPNITWEIVQENPDKPWCLFWLSLNPNITWKIVQENPNKPWNYVGLSCYCNRFGYNSNKNKERIIPRTKAIKEELMARTWNPETALGQFLVLDEISNE